MSAPAASEGAAPPPDAPRPPEQPDYRPPEDEKPVAIEEPEPDDEGDEPPGPREETVEEILEPKVNPVTRTLSDEKGSSRKYVQGPFLYFQQLEMYGLLGRAVNIVLEGENGLGMDEIFQMLEPKKLLDQLLERSVPGADDAPDKTDEETDLEEISKMLSAFTRLVASSPDIIKDFQIIVLDIPKGHRNWALEWALPRLDRETGNDIMETFIDQNWGILEGFFAEEMPRMFKRAAAARRRHKSAGARSKP